MRVLAATTLVTSIAFFAMVPFLTLYLSDVTDLSAAAIGAAVGSIALISALGSFFSGALADRVGAVTLLRTGLGLYAAVCVALSLSDAVYAVLPLIVCLGCALTLCTPSLKKLLSLAAPGEGSVIFRVRYISQSLGAVLGPLVGAGAYLIDRRALFLCAGALFGLCLLIVQLGNGSLGALEAEREPSAAAGRAWGPALKDRRLFLAVGAGISITLVFSQFESIFPLYLKNEHGTAAAAYFSGLFAFHALIGIVFQFPAQWLARRFPQAAQAAVGCMGFCGAFVLFGLSEGGLLMLAAGVTVWTLGEAILMPMPDQITHRIAPDALKGAYFGFAELRYAGFFAGPLIGGALLGIGPAAYFTTLAVLAFLALPFLASPSLSAPREAAS
ncbi:MFS transporter [Streptomyces sp. NPDC097617]|uniref:MFS transporter n=1 Tax=Streptomyces sp. NPDC097617 TaxID=3366091 RepID=UPI0038107E6B